MDEKSIAAYRRLAEQHCNRGEDDCRWYHGSWHLLKSLDIVSTSAIHEKSIARLLESAIGDRAAPRILLTGSTDETLLGIVCRACDAMGVDAAITALDVCRTPLEFMADYADRNRLQLATVQEDILEFDAADTFDVVLTHAFMGYFDDPRRQRLVAKWHDLLADQGRVVTIQRVRPADSPAIVRFSCRQASDFVAAAVRAAQRQGLSHDLIRVEEAASGFAQNFFSHAVRSKSSFEKLFLEAGMVFECLDYQSSRHRENLSGPSVPSGGEYAYVVARKV
jgi:SAM-dependent methyltransferase